MLCFYAISKLINIFANLGTTVTSKPAVSVILPFYRPGISLESAIRSITGQTFSDWELILVNNNACPASSSIAEKWSRADNRIRIVYEPVQSVAAAMNSGLRNARAGLVARMDADDISMPDRLRKQAGFLDTNPDTGAVASQTVFSSVIGNSRGFSLYVEWQNKLISHEEHYLARFVESPLAQPTIMFRKELIDRYGYYNTGDLPEDYEMWLRWFEKGVRFYKIPEPLVQWNDHGERLTRTHKNYSAESFLKVRYQYLARWINGNVSPGKKIVVCGSSSNIAGKAQRLSEMGVNIWGFTDVCEYTGKRLNFIPCEKLGRPEEFFILNLISKRGVGDEIKKHFEKLGFADCRDLILAG